MSIPQRWLTVLIVTVLLISCSASQEKLEAPSSDSVSQAPQSDPIAPLSTAEHIRTALRALQIGDEDLARRHLEQVLSQNPRQRTAERLLEQLDADPIQYLGEDYFLYTVKANDSLSQITQRFLNDPLQFTILARYNNIDNPSRLTVGQSLRIPGKKPVDIDAEAEPTGDYQTIEQVSASPPNASTANSDQRPAPGESAATDADSLYIAARTMYEAGDYAGAFNQLGRAANRDADNEEIQDLLTRVENKLEAKRLYDTGLRLADQGNAETALQTLEDALIYDPKNAVIAAKIDHVKEQLVEQYHRQALAHFSRQQLDEAIAIWDKALSIDPDNSLVVGYKTRALAIKEKLNTYK